MKSILVTSFALLTTAPAFAAPLTYLPDANHTFVRFSYSHMGFSTQLSRFDKTSGTIVYDAQSKTAAIDVTIDTKSVDTGSAHLNEDIQGADFLDTGTFPTATFKSTAVKFKGDAPVSIEGNLTVKGVTKPVTLTITSFKHGQNPMMKKDEVGADATCTIKRSDFNAGKYAPLVGDELTLSISMEALQQ
jgi:polyisoprenoid-binding protein YceI